jgi:hypothetical protein
MELIGFAQRLPSGKLKKDCEYLHGKWQGIIINDLHGKAGNQD